LRQLKADISVLSGTPSSFAAGANPIIAAMNIIEITADLFNRF